MGARTRLAPLDARSTRRRSTAPTTAPSSRPASPATSCRRTADLDGLQARRRPQSVPAQRGERASSRRRTWTAAGTCSSRSSRGSSTTATACTRRLSRASPAAAGPARRGVLAAGGGDERPRRRSGREPGAVGRRASRRAERRGRPVVGGGGTGGRSGRRRLRRGRARGPPGDHAAPPTEPAPPGTSAPASNPPLMRRLMDRVRESRRGAAGAARPARSRAGDRPREPRGGAGFLFLLNHGAAEAVVELPPSRCATRLRPGSGRGHRTSDRSSAGVRGVAVASSRSNAA